MNTNDCSIMYKGTFIYGSPADQVKVVIKGKNHTEYHNNGKYVIKSKLNWITDCEYDMVLKKVTIPNFPYQPGDVMNVKIDSVNGKEIYYTSIIKGQSWKGVFVKIKD
ncbi:MAG: hypothetical protein ACRCYO_16700 [Bacteroidia bacterium]